MQGVNKCSGIVFRDGISRQVQSSYFRSECGADSFHLDHGMPYGVAACQLIVVVILYRVISR